MPKELMEEYKELLKEALKQTEEAINEGNLADALLWMGEAMQVAGQLGFFEDDTRVLH